MEFPFIIAKVLKTDQDGFSIIESKSLAPKNCSYQSTNQYFGLKSMNGPSARDEKLAEIIDKMGEASSKVIQIIKLQIIEF